MNFISRPAQDSHASAHQALWQQLGGAVSGATQKLGVRPEHISVATNGPGIAATVVLAEQLGDASIIHMRVDGLNDLVVAKLGSGHERLPTGQSVALAFDGVPTPLAFDKDGQLLPQR